MLWGIPEYRPVPETRALIGFVGMRPRDEVSELGGLLQIERNSSRI